jgi:hypothetical protein
MNNTPVQYGFLLAALTLAAFFAVYFFFSGFNYYNISVKVNAFGLTFLYVLVTVILLVKLSRTQKMDFAEVFQNSFGAMFVGGTISFLCIVLFLNHIDPDAQALLQHQRIEQNLSSLETEYKSAKDPDTETTERYQAAVEYFNSDKAKNEKIFTLKNSLLMLGAVYSFYLAISLFLAIFFKSRNKTNANIRNHTAA